MLLELCLAEKCLLNPGKVSVVADCCPKAEDPRGIQRFPCPNSRGSLLVFALLLSFFSLTGCGSIIEKLAPVAPQQPPPSGPPPIATQGGTVTISPRYAALGQGATQQFLARGAGKTDVEWRVNGILGGNSAVGTVDQNGKYTTPTTLTQAQNVTVTVDVPGSATTSFANSVVSLIPQGVLTDTLNPQVVLYSIYLPAPGTVQIVFGPTASYGLTTWTQSTPSPNGGMVTIEVAGMLGQAAYHMQAQVTLQDGATFTDVDHVFTSGTPPATAAVKITTGTGNPPQPGIELFDTTIPGEPASVFATDLAGNVIWTYTYSGSSFDVVQPAQLLPNGDFLLQISYASSVVLRPVTLPPNTLDEIREVDLAGNTIRSLTEPQLAAALAAQGYNLHLGSFHHDVLALPNGHFLLLCSVSQTFTNLTGYTQPVSVLGDILVDVDQNFNPDWIWNSFDHLDVNRHPFLFPDWTHSNAMLYSADDHNILLSIRHQNWIVKIDFNDGTGSGDILWRLGEGGNFTLQGGTDPTDWFYAQHGPAYFSPNTTGIFTLGVMDNGNDRLFPNDATCGQTNSPTCYSTAEILRVDEGGKTATILSKYAPASTYSFYGGNIQLLPNGDYQVDFCSPPPGSIIQELNASQQIVWEATTPGSNQYRADRLPSLYPGIQW